MAFIQDVSENVTGYFQGLSQVQQYAWMAVALGALLIAAAFILG